MRYWVSNCDTTHMCVGSTVGPNIFIKICAFSTAQISRELIQQVKEEFGKIPNKLKLINCVGGGSSAAGFWNEFMNTHAEFIGVEAGGPENSKLHAAPLTNGSKIGILHGAAQYVIQDKEGQIGSTESYLQVLITLEFLLFIVFSKIPKELNILLQVMKRL